MKATEPPAIVSEPRAAPRASRAASEAVTIPPDPSGAVPPPGTTVAPHPPTTGAVDSALIRRSWPDVLKALDEPRNRVLHTIAQLVVIQNLEGDTLELVFPAGKGFAAAKIEQKQEDLRGVLRSMFGISPAIRCVVRDAPPGGLDADIEDDEPRPTPQVAAERVMEGLAAEIVDE